VVGDTSPEMNRPEGCSWIMSIRGVGAATLSDVQYDNTYDNGRMHKNVSVERLTLIVFGAEFNQPRAEHIVEVVEEEEVGEESTLWMMRFWKSCGEALRNKRVFTGATSTRWIIQGYR